MICSMPRLNVKSPISNAMEVFTQTPDQFLIGKQIGVYKIMFEIGRGGMGNVYLAEDSRLERKVAIKFLSVNAIESQDRINRFRQEARSISSLNHPNIITIHDFGYLDSSPYIVTEFVQGKMLRGVLNTGEYLSLLSAVNISIQIA
jgi:serine/threonine protein kinase